MSKAINRAYADAIRAISDLRDEAESVEDELSRQRELPKGETDGHYIDGQPIEYWHRIATDGLKLNNKLIDSLREKERINADLEQKLETAINDRDAWYKRSQHQHACASKAESERDTALRELDAMREKLKEKEEYRYYFIAGEGARVPVTREAFVKLRESAPINGQTWTVDNTREGESTLTIHT